MVVDKPYADVDLKNRRIRTFDENVSEDDLVWHRDYHDRIVTVMESNDWWFQHDNEVPFKMAPGLRIFIKKAAWHRIIKGKSRLVIEICEFD